MSDTTTTTTTAAPVATTTTTAASSLLPAATTTATTTAAASAPGADGAAADAAKTAEPGLVLPGKDATPEQWTEFYSKIGRPETADGYNLTVAEGEDKAFIGEVAGVMHKYGLTKEQALGLQKDLSEKAQGRLAAAEQAKVAQQDAKNLAEQAALKTELGEQYAPKMELAKRAVMQFAGKDNAEQIVSSIEAAVGYKATMQFFMAIGAGLGEHDAGGQGGQGNQGGEKKTTQQILYGS